MAPLRNVCTMFAGRLNQQQDMAGATLILQVNYAYDAAGQILGEFKQPAAVAYQATNVSMSFDPDNALTNYAGQTVTNDANGNMSYGPLTNGFAPYTYDVRNRLTSAGGVSYAYDPAGNRVAITNGATVTQFVVNPNTALSQVLMRIQNGVTNYYVYGAGLLYEVTQTAAATNILVHHYDYRGSTVAMTDGNGNVTDRVSYAPYGTIVSRTGTNDTPFLFNGSYGVQTDPNGLLYMRARFYNTTICRFVNPDPSGFKGGLNLYAHAYGNPIGLLDPFGLCSQSSSQNNAWQTFSGDLGPYQYYNYNGDDWGNRIHAAMLNIGSMFNNSVYHFNAAYLAPLSSSIQYLDESTGGGVTAANTALMFVQPEISVALAAFRASEVSVVLTEGQQVNRVWDSRWTPGSKYSGPFGGSYAPNSAIPINANIATQTRGLNIPGIANNARQAAVYTTAQDIPATLRQSLWGTEPEFVVDPQYRQYLNRVEESISSLPSGR